jgi:hypothetical protein
MGSFRKLLAVDVFKLQCRRPAIAARELYHRWPQSIFYLPVEPRDFTCAKLKSCANAERSNLLVLCLEMAARRPQFYGRAMRAQNASSMSE